MFASRLYKNDDQPYIAILNSNDVEILCEVMRRWAQANNCEEPVWNDHSNTLDKLLGKPPEDPPLLLHITDPHRGYFTYSEYNKAMRSLSVAEYVKYLFDPDFDFSQIDQIADLL